MLLVVVEVLADFLEHQAAVVAEVSLQTSRAMRRPSCLLDVLEAAGVGFGLREADCGKGVR